MNITVCVLIAVQIFTAANTAHSQTGNITYPVVDNPMPQFTFGNVKYYTKSTIDNSDLIGKWTILDFWTKYCTSCVASFPKVNALQRQFKIDVQFFLVGQNDHRNKNIEAIYERYRKAKNLELAVAYDSAIFQQFGIHGVPHIVVVDPKGMVYAVTDGAFLTADKIQDLIAGKSPSFAKLYNKFEGREQATFWKHFVFDKEERNTDALYRSILDRYKEGVPAGMFEINQSAIERGLYQRTRISLAELYKAAYLGTTVWDRNSPMYGAYWPHPLLAVADSSLFYTNYSTNHGFYNYQLMVPLAKSSADYLMERIQQDLNTYFGYAVTLETRTMPYWSLTATDKARKSLATKSNKTEYYGDPSGITAKRIPVRTVLELIEQYAFVSSGIPFLDETNITERIDIDFRAALTDVQDVTRELRKVGLILEKRERPMKVLVMRDPTPKSIPTQ